MKRKIALIISFVLGGATLLIAFSNCGDMMKSGEVSDTGSGGTVVQGLAPVNYFVEARPGLICGQQGYAFLLRNYIQNHCGSCHNPGGLAEPPFTGADLQLAWDSARFLNRDTFLETVTENRFCGPDCHLDPRGEVYLGIVEWQNNAAACP